MATQITNYKCPGCTGPLQFSASTGKLECEYCGSAYSAEEIEALFAEKNAAAEEAAPAAVEAPAVVEAEAAPVETVAE
jgi:uncharacterized Zn finger protein (UPF0148 family)